uniref:Eukaryotic translation elongation factor 1 beta 2 n=1 Tax=Rousettus aegyptiacus TaxID=9407 RepID=A0A7J8JGW0_ROUAE|nr:hypothetical protein HJG63_010238 [Rousettus aegyptiacus]
MFFLSFLFFSFLFFFCADCHCSCCCPAASSADTMGFGNLKSPAGLQALSGYLADKSCIKGYMLSQADVVVFETVSNPPPADLYHVLRWYNHIKSYGKEKTSLPRVKKLWASTALLMWKIPQEVKLLIVKAMMALISLDLRRRRRKVKKQRG